MNQHQPSWVERRALSRERAGQVEPVEAEQGVMVGVEPHHHVAAAALPPATAERNGEVFTDDFAAFLAGDE